MAQCALRTHRQPTPQQRKLPFEQRPACNKDVAEAVAVGVDIVGQHFHKELAERDTEINALRQRCTLLETQQNAVERIMSITDAALARIDQRDAQLSRLEALLEALLEHDPVARKTAAARLRQ